jgi:hypothetical protein
MKVLVATRGSGKTTALIHWAMENQDRVIVAASVAEVQGIIHRCPALKGRVINGMSQSIFQYQNSNVEFGIDNIDILLCRLLRLPHVDFITTTVQGIP